MTTIAPERPRQTRFSVKDLSSRGWRPAWRTEAGLALFCAWEGARRYFEDLACVIVDEIHSIWPSKRGDLLALDLARLQQFAPRMRRVGLQPSAEARWIVPAHSTSYVLAW